MLRVLNGGDYGQPGRAAPPHLRTLWRRSGEIDFMWRTRYNLAPLDPRYLDMTEEGMAEDLLMHLYAAARGRIADPTDPVGQELNARSSSAQHFLRELKAQRATYDAMAARWMNRHKAVAPRTVIRVITGLPGGSEK